MSATSLHELARSSSPSGEGRPARCSGDWPRRGRRSIGQPTPAWSSASSEILDRAGDAPFERQVDVGDEDGWIGRVDFADRRLKVVVEIQSDRFHSSLSDRRRDAERLARLRAAGWLVVEITEEEIFHRPMR